MRLIGWGIAGIILIALIILGTPFLFPAFAEKFQTLLAGLLAFLAGGAAIIGAWFGARAVISQANINSEALSRQTADEARHRIESEQVKFRGEARSIALALAAELSSTIEMGKWRKTALERWFANKTPFYGALMQEYVLPDPIVFRSLTDKIGHLKAELAPSIVRSFHSIIDWNAAANRLNENKTAVHSDFLSSKISLLEKMIALQSKTADELRAFAASVDH